MTSDVGDLYQELILDHGRRPRNFGPLPSANRRAQGHNPLCGDRVTCFARLSDDGVVADASFEGSGCAISTASASLMTERIKGMRREDVEALFQRFHALVTGGEEAAEAEEGPELRKLEALGGVAEFPMRVKCATLPWHTLRAALEGAREPVSTEEA